MGTMMKLSRRALGAGLCSLAVATASAAVAAGPFEGLSGSWSGGGTIAMNDGHNERIRCKATYEVTPSGVILHQNLRCASDSYKFEVRSSLQAEGQRITGTWAETTRQVQGDVSGTISGDRIATSVNGTGFSASLSVTTRGNAQNVSITPTGTDIKSVQVDMKRG